MIAESVAPRQHTITLTSDELTVVLLALNTRRSINATEVDTSASEEDQEGARCDIYETGIINVLEARLERARPMSAESAAGETTLAAALKPFGWTCTEDFWRRYYSDLWVFNLANAAERLTDEAARLTALIDGDPT